MSARILFVLGSIGLGQGRLQELDGLGQLGGIDEDAALGRRHARGAGPVAGLLVGGDGLEAQALGLLVAALDVGCDGRSLQQVGPFRRLVGDLQGRAQQRLGLVGGTELHGPLRCTTQGQAGLDAQGLGLGPGLGGLEGGQVVRREHAGQLVLAEALEVARGGQVSDTAVAARERVVGDLADDRLDEAVLAALRAKRDRPRSPAARRLTRARRRGSSSASSCP